MDKTRGPTSGWIAVADESPDHSEPVVYARPNPRRPGARGCNVIHRFSFSCAAEGALPLRLSCLRQIPHAGHARLANLWRSVHRWGKPLLVAQRATTLNHGNQTDLAVLFPNATRKQLSGAIRNARMFGLISVVERGRSLGDKKGFAPSVYGPPEVRKPRVSSVWDLAQA